MITINSQLDMTPGAIPVVIHRSQYDSDFSIVFTLFARTGDFTIASGTTAKVRGTKKSGTGYSADATVNVSAKTVTVYGDQQMTAVSGQNIFEIVLMSGTKELCSANFILNVERAALDMDTITDDTVIRELDNLDQFITEAEAAADRAEDAAATFSVDATLTVSGKAADAKKTGDELAKKVDAVPGKGLSTEDYSSVEKEKLEGIEAEANKTTIDTTLTRTGQAADAKTVGDAIASEDKKALAAFATDTASGAVANFPDGADSIPMKDVLVHIEPVQAGSGDPSPDNVRPISGWTGCVISHSGADMTNPTTYSITFPSEAGTVYGGTLDVTNGALTVDRAMVDLGTLAWNYSTDNVPRFGASFPFKAKHISATVALKGLSSMYRVAPFDELYDPSQSKNGLLASFSATRMAVRNDTYTDAAAFKTAMSGVQLVYELATPITYQLTPQEITSLLGTNNLWADCGDTDVEYRADTKVYVDAKVAAAESNITDLQNSKVDKTTPLLNFDDTATDPLTDDGALANALTALGILSNVIPSGGGMLYLKKALTELCERVTTTRGEITMASGFAATIKYVKRQGDLVYLDFRLGTGEPALDTWTALGTVPEGFRPSTRVVPMGYDNDYSKPCAFRIDTNGTLSVWRTSANGPHTFLSTTYFV